MKTVSDILPWLGLTVAIWFTTYLIRKYAPQAWRFSAMLAIREWLILDVIPAESLKRFYPVVEFVWGTWQALPAVLAGAITEALQTGQPVAAAWKGALAGAFAPLLHHVLKALPVPYQGAVGATRKTPPPSAGPVAALALFALSMLTDCSGATPNAAKAISARESAVHVVKASKAALKELEACEQKLVTAGILPVAKAQELAGQLRKIRDTIERAEAGAKLAAAELRELLDTAELAAALAREFGRPVPSSVDTALELARAVVGDDGS
jgi:hypothetical protein